MNQSVCFLGDSIEKGVAFDTNRGRYALLRDCFANRVAQGWNLGVRNLSRFGSTVSEGLLRFEKQKESLEDCGTVIMDFGGNDSDFHWQQISEAPQDHHEPGTPLPVFLETYCRLIDQVRESGKEPVLLNLPPVEHRLYFDWISQGLNGANILRWLGGSTAFIYRWHERYSIGVHKIAQLTQTKLIDIRSAFLERRDYGTLLCADGIHPNAQGHALIADTILAGMESGKYVYNG